MASSLAKECLSPALKGTSMRRRSLEICQQLGSQLLTPTFLQKLSPSSKSSSPKTPSPSSSLKPSPNSSNKSLTSPFKLIDDDNKSISPVFNFSIGEQIINDCSSSPAATYHSKRRASDSFWLVDNFQQKLATFEKDHELFQKGKCSQKPKKPVSSSSSFSNNKSGNSQEKVKREGESTGKSELDKSKHALQCSHRSVAAAVGDDDDGTSERRQGVDANRGKEESAVFTCNIIPATPLKRVGVHGKLQRDNMPPLQCSLIINGSSESENDEDDDEPEDIKSEDQIKTCRFQLSKRYVADNKSVRRSSPRAKYDLDDTLIELVASHCNNLSLNPDELLGKGSFGTVIAGLYQGKHVAVKVLKTTNAQKKASILGEHNALNLPFHNHIARTIDIFQLGLDRALIIMEKMPKGNLLTLLNDISFQMNCSIAINISKQVALALSFCHRQGILHLDVKPQNILFDYQNCCKLSDFGSSKRVSNLEKCYKYSKLEGTVPYTAPELFKGDQPTEKCDVYSFGITMWQIITRETPYENENEHTVIFRVVSQRLRPGNGNEPMSMNADERQSLVNYVQLYEAAWDANPIKRPTMTDVHKSLLKIQFSIG